ncbi:MAG: endonuclease MutS2 [Ruminococcaceae bacterium]|nr:endonuclease MutS2 [Oscillospiraceae bacterium]
MENKHFNTLELPKVLEMVASFTACPDASEKALALTPNSDLYMARLLMSETEAAFILLAKFGGPPFGGLKNVNNPLFRAASGGVLSMRDLLDIASTLNAIRSIISWREKSEGVKTAIDGLFTSLTANKYLEEKITSAIISEDEMSDNASPELNSIRRKIRSQTAGIREKLDKMLSSQYYRNYLQENIVTQRNGRFVVPVKLEHRADVPGMVHDTSSSGATVFIEPSSVVEANNEIKILEKKERDEIERILYELSAEAGSFAETIKLSYENAVELNLIFAKASLAYKMKANVPEINDEGIIDLKKARHPLIDEKKVVPIDIRLGEEFDTLVITGPNTGGKTVSIKTLGLFTLMAECGLMLPCAENSRISVFKNVLADIGDEQSIEQSLSTFSAHMTNIVDIMKTVDDSSLVLIDELGAGTDPVEGAALATSILESIRLKGAKTAATTHYSELKEYALRTPLVENASCEFDVKTLKPTYKLLIGIPGRSNAFAISLRLGIDEGVIERAKELVSSENSRFEDVVENLTRTKQEMEREKESAEQLKLELSKTKEKTDAVMEETKKKANEEIEKARGEALRIVENAKRAANTLLLEVEKLKKEEKNTRDAAELARKAKAAMKKQLGALEESTDSDFEAFDEDDENYVLPRELKIGDTVYVRSISGNAEVVSLPDKNGMLEVQVGVMRMKTTLSSVRLVSEKKKPQPHKGRTVPERRNETPVKTEIDLRGKTVDEALLDLDYFIDGVLRMGLNEFTVIHGKGTGALRAAVQDYLRKHPHIKSFRLGTYGEGENGVTIAEVK